jgi:hypothetical protein
MIRLCTWLRRRRGFILAKVEVAKFVGCVVLGGHQSIKWGQTAGDGRRRDNVAIVNQESMNSMASKY